MKCTTVATIHRGMITSTGKILYRLICSSIVYPSAVVVHICTNMSCTDGGTCTRLVRKNMARIDALRVKAENFLL